MSTVAVWTEFGRWLSCESHAGSPMQLQLPGAAGSWGWMVFAWSCWQGCLNSVGPLLKQDGRLLSTLRTTRAGRSREEALVQFMLVSRLMSTSHLGQSRSPGKAQESCGKGSHRRMGLGHDSLGIITETVYYGYKDRCIIYGLGVFTCFH